MNRETCPSCKADLTGPPIRPEHLHMYGGQTHYSMAIAVYDRDKDRTVAFKCSECGHEWPRDSAQCAILESKEKL